MPDTHYRFGASASRRIPVRGRGFLCIAATLCAIGLLTAGFPARSPAQSALPSTPLFGPLDMPLMSFDLIPIEKILENPSDYHLRQIRMGGVIRSIHTDVLTQGCGRIHELTTFTLEDETGMIEVLDQGVCGGNTSRLRASTLTVGDPVDLFVRIVANKEAESSRTSVEVLVIWIERARK